MAAEHKEIEMTKTIHTATTFADAGSVGGLLSGSTKALADKFAPMYLRLDKAAQTAARKDFTTNYVVTRYNVPFAKASAWAELSREERKAVSFSNGKTAHDLFNAASSWFTTNIVGAATPSADHSAPVRVSKALRDLVAAEDARHAKVMKALREEFGSAAVSAARK